MYRNQFHTRNQISLALLSRHKRSRPGRSIFDKRTSKRNSRTVRVAHRMGNARVRNSRHNVRMYFLCVSSSQHIPTLIAHLLHIDSLVGRGGISIIHPQERTDFHLIFRLHQSLRPVRSDIYDLSWSQFPKRIIS